MRQFVWMMLLSLVTVLLIYGAGVWFDSLN
jgi:VIT1/CCC1 family predicted Fe2+/Mn2+ transporter